MRILLTADPALPVPPVLYGGAERIVDLLVRELRQRGHQVGLVAAAGSTCAVDGLFPWAVAPADSPFDTMRNSFALGAAVARFKPELLHSFSRIAYFGPLLRSRLPKIMSYQRYPTPRNVRWAARLAGATLTFTGCSEFIAARGEAEGGTWSAVPNFVDPALYSFSRAVPADAPLVFLSRIEPIKGADVAIAVARKAGRRLILAGNHCETGEEGRYWRERILPELDGDRVQHVGPVDDAAKSALLARAAALLVPVQWDEPFGIVFAEALACGTPVISCPRGALPEIVREGREGFLAADNAGLVAAVERLGEIDRATCRRRVEEVFNVAAVTTVYERLYSGHAAACAAS